jgi:hypothetical protein
MESFPAGQQGRPKASEFAFARLRYDSGDWDYNPKVAANVLNSLVEYTTIPVHADEVVITADSKELLAFPFLFMTGHKLVRFSREERAQLQRYVQHGGFLFSDDCNHDVNGLYAKSFEQEMRTIFPGVSTLAKLPNTHAIYRCFFQFPDGPPTTSHEWNTAAASACSTRTRITAASGTTTGATSDSSARTTRSSRSTSWFMQ